MTIYFDQKFFIKNSVFIQPGNSILQSLVRKKKKKKMQKLSRFSQLKSLQNTLHSHKIYDAVRGEKNMKIFMESHVFAVWDFMILLKELQRKLTCMNKIWVPPKSNNTARFINQIVVGQQSDIHPDGKNHASHYELYLQAMKQVGADTSAIQNVIKNVSQGKDVFKELENSQIPEYVRQFVSNTIRSIDKPTPYVASQFFYGRQDPIPTMFQKFVNSLEENKQCQFLKYYLKRHIEVDGNDHGPLAEKLLEELAIRQDKNYELILDGAINAVSHRIKLWDGIYKKLI